MQITTLRPGLLVSLKTSLRGNVAYTKTIIEGEHTTAEGEARERWETLRRVANPEEYERAKQARSKAGQVIRSVCTHSNFGLLCPEGKAAELDAAVAQARAIVRSFNQSAELSTVGVYVITGRIAADDVEAVRAINSEVRDLLAAMTDGLKALDVEAIRDAASRARQLGAMLSPEAGARVQVAIEAAREAAKRIVKAGETASAEIDSRAIARITEARTAFLDLDDNGEERTIPAALDVAPTARALDFAPQTSMEF